MFDSICIHLRNEVGNSTPETSVDFGLIAEALLFYQKVHIVANHSFLEILLRRFEPAVLLEYLETGQLEISYLENDTGIHTENSGTSRERHKPILFSIPDYSWENHSRTLIQKASGLSGKGARRFEIRVSKYIKPLQYGKAVQEETLQDFSESGYIVRAVERYISCTVPDYEQRQPIHFQIHRDSDALVVETNIDFAAANEIYHRKISPKHSSLTPAYILSNLMTVRGEWYFASLFNSELATDAKRDPIIDLKFEEMVDARRKSESELSIFQEFAFEDARAIGDAIRLGNRSFRDLLKIVNRASKFKEWLKDKEIDEGLLREYFRAITVDSWADKLPAKSMRWVLFQIAGLGVDAAGGKGVGTALALAVGATDTFLLDRLIKGWRPNQFVERVKGFIPDKTIGQHLKSKS